MDANFPPLDDTTLQALIDQPENDNLEFKSKLLPNSLIAEYVIGIGNAGGGLLVMGVTDKRPRAIVGIALQSLDELQKIRRSIYDSTGIRVELEPVNTARGFVLALRIPARPRGTVFHTSDGKYLIRVGEALVPLTIAQLGTMLAESQQAETANEQVPVSLRFMETQHANYYRAVVTNDSDVEISPKEIWLEKDGLKLAQPARKEWPSIAPRSGGSIDWQPSRNPVDLLIIKWQERMGVRQPSPAQTFMEVIDICLAFTCRNGQRREQHERIMVMIDPINRTMMQWSW